MISKISKLETKTQEITFLVSLLSALSVLVTGLMYLFAQPENIALLTGKLGSVTLQGVFNTFGYSSFYVGMSFLWLGSYLLQKIHTPEDFKKYYDKILYFIGIQFFLLVLVASLLSIFQACFSFQSHDSMLFGAGGLFGLRIGGGLYSLFGSYGSLAIISISTLSLSILTGLLSISDAYSFTANGITYLISNLFKSIVFSAKVTINFISTILENNAFTQKVLFKISKLLPKTKNKEAEEISINLKSLESEYIEVSESNVTCPKSPKGFSSYYPELDTPGEESSLEVTIETKKPKKGKKLSKKPAKKPEEEIDEDQKALEETKANNLLIKAWTKKYKKPELQILNKPTKAIKMSKKEVEEQSNLLTTHLESFQIFGEVVDVHQGPTLTMYEFSLKAGVKLSKVSAMNDDLAMALGASSIRILAPIPGKTTIGIEIPNNKKRIVNLSELMTAMKSEKEQVLPIPMGMNVNNETIISDLTKMPHMLVSGTTGSGKSVFINTLISSLVFNKSPKELRFIMVDPKMIELSPYNGIPHLLKPVVTDTNEAKHTLQWAEKEMDRRYQLLAKTGSKDIVSFNETINKGSKASIERKNKSKIDFEWAELPYLVIIIDELADLMMTQGKEVEVPITRIAQKARACGIHMVIATQRPSSDVITGLIKTNFPTRVACKVSSSIDSRTILDTSGAEKLFGHGDLLFLPNGKPMQRLQSAYISEGEVKKLVTQASKNK